jgi:hypothetical protein
LAVQLVDLVPAYLDELERRSLSWIKQALKGMFFQRRYDTFSLLTRRRGRPPSIGQRAATVHALVMGGPAFDEKGKPVPGRRLSIADAARAIAAQEAGENATKEEICRRIEAIRKEYDRYRKALGLPTTPGRLRGRLPGKNTGALAEPGPTGAHGERQEPRPVQERKGTGTRRAAPRRLDRR